MAKEYYSSEQAGRDGSSFTNFAGDGSHVGAQFGTVFGNVHTYQVSESQSPRERYLIALSFLNAKMARRAEELITQAVEGGFTGDADQDVADDPASKITVNHVAYHWILSVLSGRSFEQLTDGQFATIERARQSASEDRSDRWLVPLDMVLRLLDCLCRQEQSGGQQAELGALLNEITALPDDFREDFQRHLDLILEDTAQDQLLEDLALAAIANRMSDGREHRAWKFFEATPEPPRARSVTEPSFPLTGAMTAAAGLLLGVLGLALSLDVILAASVIRGVLLVLVLGAGGFAVYRSSVVLLAARGRLVDKEREYGNPEFSRYSVALAADSQPDPVDEAPAGSAEQEAAKARRATFVRVTSRHVDDQFAGQAPEVPRERREWEAATARIKKAMKKEVLDSYRGARPGSVNWLITWRVRQIARMFQEKTLYSYRDRLRAPGWAAAVLLIGLGMLLFGVLALLIETFSLRIVTGLIVIVLLALAGVTVGGSRLDVYLVSRHRLRSDKADADQRLQDEQAEFERWQQELQDRPSDAEIARWLDYDKLYLRTIAMRRLGVAGRELITHATLTAAAPGSRGARVIHGPPRYSAYIVTIFLLTEAGVRQLDIRLNFETGVPSDHVRRSFQYGAIASARLGEIGVRFDKVHEEKALALIDGQRPGVGESLVPARPDDRLRRPDGSPILRQDFVLSLVSQETIAISVENFDGDFRDVSLEDSQRLLDIALDSSGISNALKVLETVAAQGRNWLSRERRLRHRHGPDLHIVQPPPEDSGPDAAANDGPDPEDDAA